MDTLEMTEQHKHKCPLCCCSCLFDVTHSYIKSHSTNSLIKKTRSLTIVWLTANAVCLFLFFNSVNMSIVLCNCWCGNCLEKVGCSKNVSWLSGLVSSFSFKPQGWMFLSAMTCQCDKTRAGNKTYTFAVSYISFCFCSQQNQLF